MVTSSTPDQRGDKVVIEGALAVIDKSGAGHVPVAHAVGGVVNDGVNDVAPGMRTIDSPGRTSVPTVGPVMDAVQGSDIDTDSNPAEALCSAQIPSLTVSSTEAYRTADAMPMPMP